MQQSAFLEDFAADVRDLLAREGETTEAIWALGPRLQGLRAHPGLPPLLDAAAEQAPPSTATPTGPSSWAARGSAPTTSRPSTATAAGGCSACSAARTTTRRGGATTGR